MEFKNTFENFSSFSLFSWCAFTASLNPNQGRGPVVRRLINNNIRPEFHWVKRAICSSVLHENPDSGLDKHCGSHPAGRQSQHYPSKDVSSPVIVFNVKTKTPLAWVVTHRFRDLDFGGNPAKNHHATAKSEIVIPACAFWGVSRPVKKDPATFIQMQLCVCPNTGTHTNIFQCFVVFPVDDTTFIFISLLSFMYLMSVFMDVENRKKTIIPALRRRSNLSLLLLLRWSWAILIVKVSFPTQVKTYCQFLFCRYASPIISEMLNPRPILFRSFARHHTVKRLNIFFSPPLSAQRPVS